MTEFDADGQHTPDSGVLDLDAVRDYLRNKVVMVTGAAGSIGSELCRQVLKCCPSKLVALDRSETGLFYLQAELHDDRVILCLADYTNADPVRGVFGIHGVHIVFHAAAYKHVSLMEANPREALQNNAFGLRNFIDLAEASGCNNFIFISSDKAVNPTSVMGCTKRIGELLVTCRPASRMRCVAVRFGNVLGSQGSVVPIFQQQLTEGKPLTVTHPEVTRFFMTADDAASLLLVAALVGKDRHILVLEMGRPVKIIALAQALIRLSGKQESEIDIRYTGLGDREKLHEQMVYEDEEVLDTNFTNIKQIEGGRAGSSQLTLYLERLQAEIPILSDVELRSKLRAIVPEYDFGSPAFRDERT